MYCKYCGKQIVDDALFCSYCGKSSIKEENSGKDIKYEYCEIGYYKKANWTGYKIYFWAIAIGKNGDYNAGASEEFTISGWMGGNPPTGLRKEDQVKSANAFSNLVKKLLADGWEPLPGKTSLWYERSFRRVLKD